VDHLKTTLVIGALGYHGYKSATVRASAVTVAGQRMRRWSDKQDSDYAKLEH
jgi:hypothetical protein